MESRSTRGTWEAGQATSSSGVSDPVKALSALTEAIAAAERVIAQAQAGRELLLAMAAELSHALIEDDDGVPAGFEYARWDVRAAELAERSVAAEIAAATRVSDRTVQRQMGQAVELVTRFPATVDALCEGRISMAHAQVIREAGADLHDDEARGAYEAVVLESAARETPGRVRRLAVREAEKVRPEGLPGRFERALQERRVWVTPLVDGMAELCAVLPAAVAFGVHSRLTGMATAHKEASGTDAMGPVEVRSMDQLRADLLAELLLRGAPSGMDGPEGHLAAITASVEVTIPADVMMRHGHWHAHETGTEGSSAAEGVAPELNGHVVLDPESARRLAGAAAGWNRVLTDPFTGAVLAVDRYRPSAELRRYLAARDSRCRFPGCGIPAVWLDLDHTEDAAYGGATEVGNLAGLCRRHHLLKHHSRWRVRQTGGGVLEWTSPAGKVYTDKPPGPATRTASRSAAPTHAEAGRSHPVGYSRRPCREPDPPPF
ncbi:MULTISPECIES: HNH endonuclease signature motif containing protein [Arthrobacter]|uniref:DUF222 domain-containing protein n=2 Tax=Arthrobacter TaxID=1663 RepID=A0ABU9KJ23_9MICC|nr:HNH endonuclease signature motif containing protein [Arthrobacter sp. YJM1]MDP5226139.1 DUF222 domain-containing protein [Arthrobacter sp. YJM1]